MWNEVQWYSYYYLSGIETRSCRHLVWRRNNAMTCWTPGDESLGLHGPVHVSSPLVPRPTKHCSIKINHWQLAHLSTLINNSSPQNSNKPDASNNPIFRRFSVRVRGRTLRCRSPRSTIIMDLLGFTSALKYFKNVAPMAHILFEIRAALLSAVYFAAGFWNSYLALMLTK